MSFVISASQQFLSYSTTWRLDLGTFDCVQGAIYLRLPSPYYPRYQELTLGESLFTERSKGRKHFPIDFVSDKSYSFINYSVGYSFTSLIVIYSYFSSYLSVYFSYVYIIKVLIMAYRKKSLLLSSPVSLFFFWTDWFLRHI